MDWIDRLAEMFRRGMEMVTELWPVKLVLAVISSVFCFLFGGSEIILVVVMVFIVLDTITKWAAVTKKYLVDRGEDAGVSATSMICGFFYAWQPGYLTSTALRKCWGEKLFTYSILIIFAGLMAKLPEMTLFGLPVNKSISGGIYTCIAMTELFSITENLEEMGNTKLGQLKQFLCTFVARITGGSYSVTVSTNKPTGQQARKPGVPNDNPGECD